jgi:hypothetical protein
MLHNFYSSQNIIRQIKSRRMMWVEHVAPVGDDTKVYKFLVGKCKGKSPLERPRHRYEDEIRMDLMEICWWGGGFK